MNNPDNFGYYSIGDLKFYSKLEAIEHHVKSGHHPHWNFNEAVFSSMDWRQEPAETLADLYRQQAQRLRDQYDYIVLWYSGGADSENILSSFVDNDIKLDEVASFVNYEATGTRINYLNAEIYEVAVPRIDQVKTVQPHLIHRLVDITQSTMDEWAVDSNKFDWIYHFNTMLGVNHVGRQNLPLRVKEWRNMFEQGKKVAFVFGADKPRVTQTKEGNFIFRFIDMVDGLVSAGNQIVNESWYNPEFFYWSPDSPKIVVKQSHVIKKYLKHATSTSAWMTEQKSDLANKIIDGKTWWLSMDGVHSLIYPNWQPVPYQFKPASALFSARDDWFRKLNDSYISYQNYQLGLHKRWNMVPDYWKNDPADMSKGYKCSWSKIYDLGL
jgi:hypothetical protein